MIIEDSQGHGAMPFSRSIQNADFSLVEVQVPQTMDMRDFKAAHFAVLEPVSRLLLAWAGLCRFMGSQPSVIPHATQHSFVAGHRFELGLLLGHGYQVVIVPLDIPTAMSLVLGF